MIDESLPGSRVIFGIEFDASHLIPEVICGDADGARPELGLEDALAGFGLIGCYPFLKPSLFRRLSTFAPFFYLCAIILDYSEFLSLICSCYFTFGS